MSIKFNPLALAGLDFSGSTVAPTSIAIGDAITGASPNKILITNGSGQLDISNRISFTELFDAALIESLDFNARQLTSGATVKLDWSGTDVSLNTRKLVNVVNPTNAQDATTKNYTDTTFVPLSQKGVANGVATLGADSKIPSSQIPAIAITDTFVVASQAAQLALSTAEQGDVAVRTDLNKSFILVSGLPSVLANWQELLTPTDSVLSVNGQTGAVVLTTTNITEGANLYYTDTRAKTATVANVINDGITDVAPSQNAVFDALALKSDLTYVNTTFIPLSQKAAANGVATLDAGSKIPASQLPSSVTVDTFVVASQSAMLSLTSAQKGDVAVRTDINKTFILAADPYTILANWQELLTPVNSVNSQTGNVVLDTDDVTEATNLYFTTSRARTAAVANAIVNGVTDVAPSQDAVFDALANKVDSVNGQGGVVVLDSDDISEGSTNLYYTNARAKAATVANAIVDGVNDVAPSQNVVFDALALKADLTYVDTTFIELTEKGAANGVATLDAGGLIPEAQLPEIAKIDVFEVVDEAAMLALTAQQGDIALRSDTNTTFVLSATPASTLSNWKEILSPAAPVSSVNSQTGAVVLDSDDISEGSTNLYFTNSRAQTAAVADSITNGITNVAPSQNAVFDALALKASLSYVDTTFIPLSQKGAANGVATLNAGGVIPNAQLPALAITDTFVVASEAAMLALSTAEQGDVAVRTDVNKSFILVSGLPSVLTNWQELLTPTDTVLSVNGQTGVVSLDSDDISEGATNLYFTDTRARTAAVADVINDGTTNVAPSQNAVFDALANKASTSLNNLTTTSINQALLPDTNIIRNLGSPSLLWGRIHASTFFDQFNILNIHLQNRRLHDSTGVVALDYTSRNLLDTTGASALAWGTTTIDVNTRRIINTVDPIGAQDAATKNYVDVRVPTLTKGQLITNNGTNNVALPIAANGRALIYNSATSSGLDSAAIPVPSAGDLNETTFSIANNQTTLTNVTGFLFPSASVRSFEALVSVTIDATVDLFQTFKLIGINRGSSWTLSIESVGDASGVSFDITNAGQVQYTSVNYAGFVSGTMKFRAITTGV